MATSWSAENAVKAYLTSLNMGNEVNTNQIDLDESQFISALAAGHNARLIVVACADGVDLTTLALAAAARQTEGRVICILPRHDLIEPSKHVLGRLYEDSLSHYVEFVVGEVRDILLILNDDKVVIADFVAIDCNLLNHGEIIQVLMMDERRVKDVIVLAYNYAFIGGGGGLSPVQLGGGVRARLLPIGNGLMVAIGKSN